MVIDAGNLKQRIKTCLTILAIFNFGEVDGMVVLSHRPTKLNAILVSGGICQIRGKQSCGQQQSNDRGKLFMILGVIARFQTLFELSGPEAATAW